MAAAQLLALTHGVDHKVTRIDDEVKVVGDNVRDIGDTVTVVHEGTRYVISSYSFLRERICYQMEKKQKQSCNRQQKRRLQICYFWQTTLPK